MEIENNPEDVNAGVRKVAFARELFIERDDFMEDAPKKFFRLTPGQEVRLKGAYIIKCTGVDKDAGGNITLIHCTYDPESRSGSGCLLYTSYGYPHFGKPEGPDYDDADYSFYVL